MVTGCCPDGNDLAAPVYEWDDEYGSGLCASAYALDGDGVLRESTGCEISQSGFCEIGEVNEADRARIQESFAGLPRPTSQDDEACPTDYDLRYMPDGAYEFVDCRLAEVSPVPCSEELFAVWTPPPDGEHWIICYDRGAPPPAVAAVVEAFELAADHLDK